MTYSELKTATLQLLIVPSTVTQIANIINQELNSGQKQFLQIIISNYKQGIEGFQEIGNYVPGLISSGTIITNSGQSEYTLNSDVVLLLGVTIDDQPIDLIEFDDTWLEYYRPDSLSTTNFLTARRYGEKLIINPAQLDGRLIKYNYVSEPTDMSGTNDTPSIAPEHHERLKYYAAYMAAQQSIKLVEGYTPQYLL